MSEQNNFYAYLDDISKTKLKETLEKRGWTSRKASWTAFELTNSWAEIILDSDDGGTLLNGRVAFHPENLKHLDEIFNLLNVSYCYEFYDNDRNLIFEKKH
jgi:hypothetical protein